jgi:hypothetical protein
VKCRRRELAGAVQVSIDPFRQERRLPGPAPSGDGNHLIAGGIADMGVEAGKRIRTLDEFLAEMEVLRALIRRMSLENTSIN